MAVSATLLGRVDINSYLQQKMHRIRLLAGGSQNFRQRIRLTKGTLQSLPVRCGCTAYAPLPAAARSLMTTVPGRKLSLQLPQTVKDATPFLRSYAQPAQPDPLDMHRLVRLGCQHPAFCHLRILLQVGSQPLVGYHSVGCTETPSQILCLVAENCSTGKWPDGWSARATRLQNKVSIGADL